MADKNLGINPWTHIWTNPRETIRKIVDFNPKYRFILLSFLYGLPMLFYWAQDFSLGASFNVMGIVIASIVLAILVGFVSISVGSALVLWTGKWIGGKSTYYPIRAAISWSCVPNVISIILWAILIYVFGKNLFLNNFPQETISTNMMFFGVGLVVLQGVLAVWSFIICLKGIAEVQGFSAWKALLNVLIPFVMVLILVWLVVFLLFMLTAAVGG